MNHMSSVYSYGLTASALRKELKRNGLNDIAILSVISLTAPLLRKELKLPHLHFHLVLPIDCLTAPLLRKELKQEAHLISTWTAPPHGSLAPKGIDTTCSHVGEQDSELPPGTKIKYQTKLCDTNEIITCIDCFLQVRGF